MPKEPVDPIRSLFAHNVRRLRASRGWSQFELADRSGFHKTYIGDLERAERNITIDNIAKLARGFGVEADEFFRPVAPAAR